MTIDDGSLETLARSRALFCLDHEYAIEQKQATVTCMYKTVASSSQRKSTRPSLRHSIPQIRPERTSRPGNQDGEKERLFKEARRRLCNRLLLLLQGGAAILARTHPPPLFFWHEAGREGDPVVHVGDSGEVGNGNGQPETHDIWQGIFSHS